MKKPVKKRAPKRRIPKTFQVEAKRAPVTVAVTSAQLEKLARETSFLAHQARLADFHYKQRLVREFKRNYEDYIG